MFGKKLIALFGDNLERYYVSDETGFYLYDTGVKRLYSPTFVAVNDGKIVAMHEKLVDTYDNTNRELTKEEKEELKKEYIDVIESLKK